MASQDPGGAPASAPGPPDPEFGPKGYLPPRAASRARKIILRGPLGAQWVVASVLTAVLLAGVGVAYVQTLASPPGEPFVHAVAVDELDAGGATEVDVDGRAVVAVRGGGALRAFEAPEGTSPVWCPASERLEGSEGQVWLRDGRLVGGTGDSLAPLRVEAFDGDLFVDPQPLERPSPDDRDERPACM